MSVAGTVWVTATPRHPLSQANRRIPACLGAMLLLLFVASAAAQQAPQDLGQASLEELGSIQVYSASKHMQSASDAPSSVSVITADEIQKYGYRTLADILESVRGFYVTYDRDYTFIGVRGFGRLGDWNSRVLLLVDGHRINNNVDGQAMIGSEFLIDVDLIERVEIVRGPSSSLYGSQAFLAVINVITRRPPHHKNLELSFAPASFGTLQGRATYGTQYHGVGMLLSGTFYNSVGPTLFYPQFDSPATNYGVTKNTDYENFEHILATLTFHGFTLQGLFSARDKVVPTGYFGTIFNDPRTANLDYHQYLDLSYQHSIGDGLETRCPHLLRSNPPASAAGLLHRAARWFHHGRHLLFPGKLVGWRSQAEPHPAGKTQNHRGHRDHRQLTPRPGGIHSHRQHL